MMVQKATPELLESFYGHPMKRSCHAYVAVDDGKVYGVAGYYNDQARRVIFLDTKEGMRKYPKLMLKTARMIVAEALSRGIPLHAACDDNIESAARFLKRLGFVEDGSGVYICQAKK